MKRFVASLGDAVLESVGTLGAVAILAIDTSRRALRRPFECRRTLQELEKTGWKSMGVIGLLGLFTGMVLVVQTGFTLRRFGAELYASEMVALSMVRELGPVLAGFLVAGRVGAGIAAEIGSMQISEQIDAMRSLGADPIKELVLPKALAMVVGLPMLTAFADLVGIVGGMAMAKMMLNISPFQFINRVQAVLEIGDFCSGLVKTAFFGAIIAIVACHYGLNTEGGTVGVGRSVTRSVVLSCMLILAADLLLTSVMVALGGITSV